MSHTTGSFKYIPLPRENQPDIYSIDYKKLKKYGFKTLFFDYDFTVTVWKEKKLNKKTLELFERLLNDGFNIAIVTNANKKRVEHVEKILNGKISVYSKMRKPGVKKLKKVIKEMNAEINTTAIIGDLFMTDILAGNKLGLYTILINPYTYGLDHGFKKTMAIVSRVLYFLFFYTIGWFFRVMDLAVPNEFKKNIFEIDYEKIKNTNHKLIIFDFDNTLVPWHTSTLSKEVTELFKKIQNLDMNILIASNGGAYRFDEIKKELKKLNISVMNMSLKPLNFKLLNKIKEYDYKSNECVLIGDQLYTDIIAGNSCGIYTIKVDPLSKTEGKWTKFVRRFEKISIKMMRKKPTLLKEEKSNEM
ncbi:hypothetical protein OSSY52_09690 [Tepiditoga spiralis]|uniref:Haloacid dehalogenase n=1 Tax=Tepiditoga spiralis TaxID=2108365 RepID=A0A7G1G347_9BACT|nr:YqeG family HAD IIIA-type phosphatase [Tepiditoga spiralis]BBE30828.1 hypothetical protein OSSY52_09690 [Tepiditoga spiralis]